jgi:AraC-like DNA-binding protein
MHVVVRLSDEPVRIFDRADASEARAIGCTVIGGVRSRFHVKDVSRPARAVGAMLRPGAALSLLGAPAEAFSERHTPLEDVWGRGAGELRERLLEASPAEQLARFEQLLSRRLPRVRGIHPAVAFALERFATSDDIGEIVAETGYSHRRFLTLFRESVGLAPKRYGRVRRVHHLLEAIERAPETPWSELAFAAGFSDQSHLTRELSEIAGVTPGAFRRIAPRRAHHVPIR